MGRPSKYTKELADKICERLSCGRGLRSICRNKDISIKESTVRAWCVKDINGFYAQYARARKMRLDAWVDDIIEIADDGTNDYYEDSKGNLKFDQENVNRSRLRVDTRKWIMAKLNPEKYGDSQKIEHGGSVGITGNGLSSLLEEARKSSNNDHSN